jgi:hypothetical protein
MPTPLNVSRRAAPPHIASETPELRPIWREAPTPAQRKRVRPSITRHAYTIPVVRETPSAIDHGVDDPTW